MGKGSGVPPLLLDYLLLTESETWGGDCVCTSEATRLQCSHSPNPVLTQMALIKLNDSPHKTRTYEPCKGTGREDERLVETEGMWGAGGKKSKYTT